VMLGLIVAVMAAMSFRDSNRAGWAVANSWRPGPCGSTGRHEQNAGYGYRRLGRNAVTASCTARSIVNLPLSPYIS
jgi:hypothetical protein